MNRGVPICAPRAVNSGTISQLTQWGTATLTYDANGNMLSSGTDGYTWDARNQLVSTLSGASFQYDPFGGRAQKTVGGGTTAFLYDGSNPVQQLSGATPTANLLSGGIPGPTAGEQRFSFRVLQLRGPFVTERTCIALISLRNTSISFANKPSGNSARESKR